MWEPLGWDGGICACLGGCSPLLPAHWGHI